MEVKLYEYTVCPFCWKVKALLNYKKIPYEAIEVHPLNKKEIKFSEGYKKVPIVIDGKGAQINDSSVIMRALDQEYGQSPVFDGSPFEEHWMKWADQVLVKALPPLIYRSIGESLKAFNYITNVTKFNRLEKVMIKYSGALVMRMVSKKSAARLQIKNPQKHFTLCLDEWSKALENRDLSKPNGADLAVFGILKSIQQMPAFSHVKANKDVYQWFSELDKII